MKYPLSIHSENKQFYGASRMLMMEKIKSAPVMYKKGMWKFIFETYIGLHLLGLPEERVGDLPGGHDGHVDHQQNAHHHEQLVVFYHLQHTTQTLGQTQTRISASWICDAARASFAAAVGVGPGGRPASRARLPQRRARIKSLTLSRLIFLCKCNIITMNGHT